MDQAGRRKLASIVAGSCVSAGVVFAAVMAFAVMDAQDGRTRLLHFVVILSACAGALLVVGLLLLTVAAVTSRKNSSGR